MINFSVFKGSFIRIYLKAVSKSINLEQFSHLRVSLRLLPSCLPKLSVTLSYLMTLLLILLYFLYLKSNFALVYSEVLLRVSKVGSRLATLYGLSLDF